MSVIPTQKLNSKHSIYNENRPRKISNINRAKKIICPENYDTGQKYTYLKNKLLRYTYMYLLLSLNGKNIT